MGLFDREVGLALAATAVATSPRAREVARRGAVYGLAGAMRAGDVVWGTARGAVLGARDGFSGGGGGATEAAEETVDTVANAGEQAAPGRGRRRTPAPAPAQP